MKRATPTGAVIAIFLVKILAIRNSFQAIIKQKTKVAKIPGRINGIIIFIITPVVEHPSTYADSSISLVDALLKSQDSFYKID